MYVHASFQCGTIYNKKVTREEEELFDQPSNLRLNKIARDPFGNHINKNSATPLEANVSPLRCVHSLLQRSCSTDVSITYLPQLNATHCTSSSLPCSTAMQQSAQRRKYDHSTYRNAAAVDYELALTGHTVRCSEQQQRVINMSTRQQQKSMSGALPTQIWRVKNLQIKRIFPGYATQKHTWLNILQSQS